MDNIREEENGEVRMEGPSEELLKKLENLYIKNYTAV